MILNNPVFIAVFIFLYLKTTAAVFILSTRSTFVFFIFQCLTSLCLREDGEDGEDGVDLCFGCSPL